MNTTNDAHELQKEARELSSEAWKKRPRTINRLSTTPSLRNSNQQELHHGPSSRICTCRSKGLRKLHNDW